MLNRRHFLKQAGLTAGSMMLSGGLLNEAMAAGDVKLMAVVGCFLGPQGAVWAAALTLIAGSLIGILILFAFVGFQEASAALR